MVHPILEELNVDVTTRAGQTFLLAGQISITRATLFTKFDYISAEQTFFNNSNPICGAFYECKWR